MRRTTSGLAAALLGSLALAAPAAADNEIVDDCGVDDASLPGLVARDPTAAPWLDLCGADVRGTAGKGLLRGIHTTLHLAGDTANRAGSAAYSLAFQAGTCSGNLLVQDLGPTTAGQKVSINGHCDAKTGPCEDLPIGTCTTGGVTFERQLPATAAKIAGSTVTLDFDPNTLPTPGTPKSFLNAFRAGQSLSSVTALSYARVQYAPMPDYYTMAIADSGDGEKPVALGGTRQRSRR